VSSSPKNSPLTDVSRLDQLIGELGKDGLAIIDDAFSASCLTEITAYREQLSAGDFRPSGVGRGNAKLEASIRTDEIHWVEPNTQALQEFFAAMELIRAGVNQRFLLGLFDFECHFAQYAPGGFYKKHIDAFRGKSNRKLSLVFYLNEQWQSGDGGELIIYQPQNHEQIKALVEPRFNRLVCFLSEDFPHQVMPSNKLRHSLTGWFRIRE
jgi:SM-20-related protein